MNRNINEAKRWLAQAKQDLKAAQWNSYGKFYEDACFLSQQAAEKGLKAFCYSQGERNVLGHSTLKLIKRCQAYSTDFKKFISNCKLLDKHYITSRYPNGLPEGTPHEYYDKDDALEAISAANKILKKIESLL